MNSKWEIQLFADCHATLSESPMWHPREKVLYWRGFEGEIYRKKIGTPPEEYECFRLSIGLIGSMVFTETETILLFADKGTVWKWIPGEEPVLYRTFGGALFNDVIADPNGRIYCGMLAENYFVPGKRGAHGSFWRLDPDGSFVCLEDAIGTTPNGIRFSPELDKLYFGVTDDNVVYEYDYNIQTGELSNRRVYAEDCSPDGIAMDRDGNLWVTDCRPGNPLIAFDRAGNRVVELVFPVRRVISAAFGGENRELLFVTTAHEGAPRGKHDGGVFLLENTAGGTDEFLGTGTY